MNAKLYPVDGPWQGQLAILLRPRGGDWLEDEIAAWKNVGVDVVVSALTPEEIESMDLGLEEAAARGQGLEFISFPIPDRGTPESIAVSAQIFGDVLKRLNKGKHVGVHCRQGIGRSSLLAATLLILGGVDPEDAWQRVEAARGCEVPESAEQKAWVERFTRTALAGTLEQ
jgi:protein-tyrosine phosphatase